MNETTDTPRYRIGAVAKMVGISTHALRAWERRYGALSPERTGAGDRLYVDGDVARLRIIKALLGYGHSIGHIATLPARELSELIARHRSTDADGSSTDAIVRRYLDAIDAMDIEGAERVLVRATTALSPFEVVQRVLAPALEAVGERWQDGSFCIAQEHAASALVRGHLSNLVSSLRPTATAPLVIATTPSGELHELGALMAAVAAALRGWRTVYLGPNLPASEIQRAADRAGARAVLLSIVSLDAERATEQLHALARGLPPRTELVIGGRAAEALRELPPRVRLLRSLQELDGFLTA
ncbi:MAG: MerR family transcriptional regulator [Polyangiaceae bacterium]|nr:MerR family transcriptional regulator [Polyangiaceae bacterium]